MKKNKGIYQQIRDDSTEKRLVNSDVTEETIKEVLDAMITKASESTTVLEFIGLNPHLREEINKRIK